MKTYRKAIADVFVLREVLEYLAGRADDMMDSANRARESLKECEDERDEYFEAQVVEYEAKAAAFERMLEKLSK